MRWFVLNRDGKDRIGFVDGDEVFVADGLSFTNVADILAAKPVCSRTAGNIREAQSEAEVSSYFAQHSGLTGFEAIDFVTEWIHRTTTLSKSSVSVLRQENLPAPIGSARSGDSSQDRFRAPLNPSVGDVMAIGRNYAEHAGEWRRLGADRLSVLPFSPRLRPPSTVRTIRSSSTRRSAPRLTGRRRWVSLSAATARTFRPTRPWNMSSAIPSSMT